MSLDWGHNSQLGSEAVWVLRCAQLVDHPLHLIHCDIWGHQKKKQYCKLGWLTVLRYLLDISGHRLRETRPLVALIATDSGLIAAVTHLRLIVGESRICFVTHFWSEMRPKTVIASKVVITLFVLKQTFGTFLCQRPLSCVRERRWGCEWGRCYWCQTL